MTNQHKHAVLTGTRMYTLAGDALAWEAICIPSLSCAWQEAQTRGITHLWVMPGSEIEDMGREWLECDARDYSVFVRSTPSGKPVTGRCRRRDRRGHEIIVHYPQRAGFPWSIETPADILFAIDYLEKQLGVIVEWSPKHIARELLTTLWAKKPEVVADAPRDLRDLPFGQAAYQLSFQRAITPDMIGKHVHHLDKNSDHFSAAGYVDTGYGDPIHLEGGIITAGLPGIYRVTWSLCNTGNFFDGIMLPTIIDPRQQWITNDVLKFAARHGYEMKIKEAWIFSKYARVLGEPRKTGGLAKMIWNARQALNPSLATLSNETAQYNAYDTCKGMATTLVGAFNTNKATHLDIRWIHPNWWADIVGQARVAELANLEKYCAANPPIIIEADALYIISADPDPATAIPGILDRSDKLGGYKHCGTCELTQAMYDLSLTDPKKLANAFKVAAGEKE